MTMEALARNAWMIAIRGGLVILFGFALLMPGVSFGAAVVLFGVYAIVDGAWAMTSAFWAARPMIGSLAVIVEGFVSVMLGLVASWLLGTAGVTSLFLAILIQMLTAADVARAVYVIAGYAIVFGIVVILAAYSFRREFRMRSVVRA